MKININTNRKTLLTWRQACTWAHVWWLQVVAGLDLGTLDRDEIPVLARRFRHRLSQMVDVGGFYRHGPHAVYPFQHEAENGWYRTLAGVLETVTMFLRNPEKYTSFNEFAYRVTNEFTDAADYSRAEEEAR